MAGYPWGKRVMDLLLAIPALTILSPLLLLLVIWVRADSPGPALFAQERVGRNRRPFRMYKLRTMYTGAGLRGSDVATTTGDPRVTRIGRFLRAASLDELPQLLNVIRGEMSLVGPRPTLAYQVERYTERQMRRLSVPPGITGYAQVHGRRSLAWPERIELDLWYVDNWSLTLDLRLLCQTAAVVVRRQDTEARAERDDPIARLPAIPVRGENQRDS